MVAIGSCDEITNRRFRYEPKRRLEDPSARLSYVDDKTLLYLAEALRVQVQELFLIRAQA